MAFNPFDPPSVEDFFSGGAPVAAKWPKIGFTVEGTVLDWSLVQQTDMATGEFKFFEDKKLKKESELSNPEKARPAYELRLDLQCEATGVTWEGLAHTEKVVPDDDGIRRAYVYGNMQKSLGRAMSDAGAAAPEKGARVKITRTKDVKAAIGTARTFESVYAPAAKNATAVGDFLSQDTDDKSDRPF